MTSLPPTLALLTCINVYNFVTKDFQYIFCFQYFGVYLKQITYIYVVVTVNGHADPRRSLSLHAIEQVNVVCTGSVSETDTFMCFYDNAIII